MKIRFQKSEVFPQGVAPSDEKRLLQVIEICGRTAYKSEDKITDDSAKAFVLMLKKHGHLSVLEHSNIVLKIEADAAAKGSANHGCLTRRAFRHSSSEPSKNAMPTTGSMLCLIFPLAALPLRPICGAGSKPCHISKRAMKNCICFSVPV